MNEKVIKEDFIKALKSNAEINDDVLSKVSGGKNDFPFEIEKYGKPCPNPKKDCKSTNTWVGTTHDGSGNKVRIAMCYDCKHLWYVK